MVKLAPNEADKYFELLQPAQQKVLLELRKRIAKIAGAQKEMVISYQLPTFVVGGKKFLALGAWQGHYAIYPLSGALGAKVASKLNQGEIEKGTIRFAWHEKVTDETIKILVEAKSAEILERGH
jgi:uncharacterized protein YdhG (YjbR/CyaY superfamily)